MLNDFFAESVPTALLTQETAASACDTATRCDFSALDSYPLAMAYVPCQKYESVLTPEEGLTAGSMFRNLVLPKEGVCGV